LSYRRGSDTRKSCLAIACFLYGKTYKKGNKRQHDTCQANHLVREIRINYNPCNFNRTMPEGVKYAARSISR